MSILSEPQLEALKLSFPNDIFYELNNELFHFPPTEENINKFAKGEELNTRNDETYILMKQEFSKVLDQINSCLNYYQIDNIKVIDEYDKPISKIWIKLIPSDNYLDYLNKIKFIPHGKFFAKKK